MNKDWLDIGILEDYLDGKLDAKTMNRVEREALDDPFVAEALAGLSESPKRSLQSISLLQKQLHERIAQQQTVKKTSVITWQRLSIAAAAAVLFIAVSIMFWMRENNHQKELAGRAKKVEVSIAPMDSIRETAPVVAAAPTAPAATVTRDRVKKDELEKAIRAAKTNSYAARAKTENYDAARSVATVAAAAPQQLNDVVIVGYGTQKRSDLVGSISTVSLAPGHVLSGKVIAMDDGKALPGVSVRVEGGNLTAVTDANGEFKINADTSVKTGLIHADYIGFKRTEALAKVNQPVNIVLAPENSTLNETVIVGYGKAKKERAAAKDSAGLSLALSGRIAGVNTNKNIMIRGTSSLPKSVVMVSNPVGGWDKLFAYIKTNNSFAHEKKTGQVVELSFRIAKDGSPADIKIVQGAAAKYEEEAIRLILNGPKWEVPEKSRSRMTFQITF
ncbi:carboxypeptidase-like regulatory domain-containing protein [Pedobacter heparinus]|uniref:carboxypeptidase-like regulatory domain-containing protein n=1 Tax=Pedobacter heparinus TaxID=984 RepID=UPI0029301369|nr:carboxypeptidase-like regulatory domain-containing protein [Pedobacter heparinus]